MTLLGYLEPLCGKSVLEILAKFLMTNMPLPSLESG